MADPQFFGTETPSASVRLFAVVFFAFLMSSVALGSTISSEKEVVRLGEPTEVEIMVNYSSFTADRVSVLVPSSHRPENIQATDERGDVSCELRDQYGKEILCDPGNMSGTYNILISYTTDLPSETNEGKEYISYTHPQRFLVPTDMFSLTVILPEGYGIVEKSMNPPYEPENARTGSEGRRIFVTWNEENISLGDSEEYVTRYQELNVFENVVPQSTTFFVAFVILMVAVFAAVYVRRQSSETIASIMPVLKKDEQEVMRYIISNEGECEQRQLVEDLSYSKAKISNLVSDLVERNLIEKIKEGRTNRLVVKKEIGDVDVSV